MRALLFVFICSTALSQDISPHVKCKSVYSSSIANFSGTIFRQREGHVDIITCYHPFLGFEKPRQIEITLYTTDKEVKAKVNCLIKKYHKEMDICILTGVFSEEILNIPQIAEDRLNPDAEVESYGFPGQKTKLHVSKVKNPNYTNGKTIPNSYDILLLYGLISEGMSGGAVIKDNKIYGIHSTCNYDKYEVGCTPSYQIKLLEQ